MLLQTINYALVAYKVDYWHAHNDFDPGYVK